VPMAQRNKSFCAAFFKKRLLPLERAVVSFAHILSF
jgi:hypothetical protein